MSPYSICFAKRPRSKLLRSQLPCILCEQRQQSWAASSLLRPPGSPWHCGSSCLLPGHATEPEQLIDGHPPGAWETKNPWCGVLSTEKAQGIGGGPKEETMILPKAMFWPFQPCRCAEKCGGREAGWTQVSRVSRSLGISSRSLSSAVFHTGVTATFPFKYPQWTWNQLGRCLWTSRVHSSKASKSTLGVCLYSKNTRPLNALSVSRSLFSCSKHPGHIYYPSTKAPKRKWYSRKGGCLNKLSWEVLQRNVTGGQGELVSVYTLFWRGVMMAVTLCPQDALNLTISTRSIVREICPPRLTL